MEQSRPSHDNSARRSLDSSISLDALCFMWMFKEVRRASSFSTIIVDCSPSFSLYPMILFNCSQSSLLKLNGSLSSLRDWLFLKKYQYMVKTLNSNTSPHAESRCIEREGERELIKKFLQLLMNYLPSKWPPGLLWFLFPQVEFWFYWLLHKLVSQHPAQHHNSTNFIFLFYIYFIISYYNSSSLVYFIELLFFNFILSYYFIFNSFTFIYFY